MRGAADAYLRKNIGARLVSDILSAEFKQISDRGHFIQFDEPDRLVASLRDFLERQS